MTHQDLPISSFRDLSPRYTAFAEEDDEYGNPIYLFSSFGFFTSEYEAYFGQSKSKVTALSVEEIKECLQRLPDDDVYPELPTSAVTTFWGPIDERLFLKRPKLNIVFIGTGLLPKLMLQEVETLELLLRTPHPNIIRYHGCLTKRGRIVGLVFDRHEMTIQQRLDSEMMRHIDVDSFMAQVESALEHLHMLGLAHNDLNPMNIMIDDRNETPYLIDFGSCRPFGCKLITAGTPGWIDEEYSTSARVNDETALKKLRTWLIKE
jgi:serine/threonine protein kinase